MGLRWNRNQREIFNLYEEGKSFSVIRKLGYPPGTISRVKHSIERGEKPGSPQLEYRLPKVAARFTHLGEGIQIELDTMIITIHKKPGVKSPVF